MGITVLVVLLQHDCYAVENEEEDELQAVSRSDGARGLFGSFII
jgi:hypothetical protein